MAPPRRYRLEAYATLRDRARDFAAHFREFRAEQSYQSRIVSGSPTMPSYVDRSAGDRFRAIRTGNRPVSAENDFAIVISFEAFQTNPDVILVIHQRRFGRKPVGSYPGTPIQILCDSSGYALIQWFRPACRCRVLHLNSPLQRDQTALGQIGGYVNAANKNSGTPGLTRPCPPGRSVG